MHIVDTVQKNDILTNPLITMFATPPADKIKECDRLEVWGTDFTEGNSDFCEYRLMKGDEVIWNKRIAGY